MAYSATIIPKVSTWRNWIGSLNITSDPNPLGTTKKERSMRNKQALISAALLEAIWSSRKKDMIDLITPFILYAVAKKTSPGEAVDTKVVQKYVQEHYAYPDLPESIVKSALSRNPLSAFERREKLFYLKKPIDDEINRMNQRERECNDNISLIGNKLSSYLVSHCRKNKAVSIEDATNKLHMFFARYGLEIGTDTLDGVEIKPNEYEIDYYIARFIFECKDADSQLYSRIIDLVKGYFLRLAIYIQPNNGNIQSASFANTSFVLDTPVLIDLLGYKGTERENSALSLYKMLKRQNATLFYLPNIKQEMINILTAYKYSLIPGNYTEGLKTLEGLNSRSYDTSDVEREILILESKLESIFGIKKREMPAYATKSDHTVDESQVLGEAEIKQYIRDNTAHYTDENLESDVASVMAIHKFRQGIISNNIESSGYVFVTNNADFVQTFNKYYRENVEKETFQLAITVNSLSAITWIKNGEVENLSETALLKNAYCAMQPIPEMLNKLEEVLNKMKDSGQIMPEQVVALRASRVFQNDLWRSSFGDLSAINEYSVGEAQKKYEDTLLKREKEKHDQELEDIGRRHDREVNDIQNEMRKREETHQIEMRTVSEKYAQYIKQRDDEARLNLKKQRESARKKADQEASKAREDWINPRLTMIKIGSWVLVACGICGLVISLVIEGPVWTAILLSIYCLISSVSAYDTVFSRKSVINDWLIKQSYQYETKIREEKLKEYSSLLTVEESIIEEANTDLVGV